MNDEEEELGDIPVRVRVRARARVRVRVSPHPSPSPSPNPIPNQDEFLDEITSEIMSDPVRLPSGNLVDRATIARHLLSNETNPFTRQKLTADMLEDAPEVKQQIAEYRAKCRAEVTLTLALT